MLWAAEVQTAKRDGTLYGSTMISMRLFRVDPTAKADALTDLGRVGWGSGEIYNQLACDGRVFFGSYGGVLALPLRALADETHRRPPVALLAKAR